MKKIDQNRNFNLRQLYVNYFYNIFTIKSQIKNPLKSYINKRFYNFIRFNILI